MAVRISAESSLGVAAVRVSVESGLRVAAVRMQIGSEMMKTSAMRLPQVSGVEEFGVAATGSSAVLGASEVSAVSCVVAVGAPEGSEVALRSVD